MGYFLADLVVRGMIAFPTGVPSTYLEDTRRVLKEWVEIERITIDQYETLTGETYRP